MNDGSLRLIAALGLVVGSVLGIAGTFAPSPSLRALAWGIDGTALVAAGALLAVYHLRRAHELAAAGFVVFVAGQALILSSNTQVLEPGNPSFASGTALWAASLAIVSASNIMPLAIRGLGLLASLLFVIVAVQIFMGQPLTPLSEPLPFFAYPFFAATLCSWAWMHYRGFA